MSGNRLKVLVTGADGFIGSHLVEKLLEDGHEVKAMVHYNAFHSRGWLDTLPSDKLKQIEIIAGDVRDPHGMKAAMKGAEVVHHLAALIGIPYSYHSPDSYIDTNVKGTLNVLQSARDCDVQRLLVTSTSEVYGSAQTLPMEESHPLHAQSPYAASKTGADALALSFHRSFGLPLTIVRPFNTYGPRQSARAVIPAIIIQLLSGKRGISLGSVHPVRDWVYVSDVANAFALLADSPAAVGQEVNVATGHSLSVGQLAERLIQMLNLEAVLSTDQQRLRPSASEVERLQGSAAKLQSLTGWAPSVSLEEGLQRTIDWFSEPENRKSYKADEYAV